MPKRHKPTKKQKKLEKDIKQEKKVWKQVKEIHQEDESFLQKLKKLFKKKK